jgi:tetratricopeptide (TPR) repeat protein
VIEPSRAARAPVSAAAAAALALFLLFPPAAARAQTRLSRPFVFTVPDVQASAPVAAPAQRPGTPLNASQAQRLLQAQAFRDQGRFEQARDVLQALLAETPHQPLVLTELARLLSDRQQWGAIERLGRTERAATRDSVLLGQELVMALEKQSRAKEAAQTAVEAWIAAPAASDEWVEPALIRLEAADPRGVHEVMRRAAEARLDHGPLVRLTARLLWRSGDTAGAAKLLAAADALKPSTPTRWGFAEELLFSATSRDTAGAIDAFVDLAGDHAMDPAYRMPAARRAFQLSLMHNDGHAGALRVAHALGDLAPSAWAQDLLVAVVRALRESGETADVRALLDRLGDRRDAVPELRLEGALNELREGPSPKALAVLEQAAHSSVEGVYRYAEALFFAGMPDSAASLYRLVSHDPAGPFTGAALERLFLIEDAQPREALPAFGRLAYEQWRGDAKLSLTLSDSLYRVLPHGATWAQAAMALAAELDRGGDAKAAIEPLLAVADSLPGDRLAPLARQKAGDLYRLRLKDDAKALEQYEEFLTSYPKAWNASEVRRVVETLRRERRF